MAPKEEQKIEEEPPQALPEGGIQLQENQVPLTEQEQIRIIEGTEEIDLNCFDTEEESSGVMVCNRIEKFDSVMMVRGDASRYLFKSSK